MCTGAKRTRQNGLILLFFTALFHGYITFWLIITPFIDKDIFIQDYFLPRELALTVLVTIGIFVMAWLLVSLSLLILNSQPRTLPRSFNAVQSSSSSSSSRSPTSYQIAS